VQLEHGRIADDMPHARDGRTRASSSVYRARSHTCMRGLRYQMRCNTLRVKGSLLMRFENALGRSRMHAPSVIRPSSRTSASK
jgi:hypothetical protein